MPERRDEILNAIVEWFREQFDNSMSADWVEISDVTDAGLDGRFNLADLAETVATRLDASKEDE